MLKRKDKIKVMRKSENSNTYFNDNEGIILDLSYNKSGEVIFVKYLQRDWPSLDAAEWVAVNAARIKVVKI